MVIELLWASLVEAFRYFKLTRYSNHVDQAELLKHGDDVSINFIEVVQLQIICSNDQIT